MNKANLEKHAIDFLLSTEVCSDALTTETTRIVNGEERIQIIGKIDDSVISVAYTWRGTNIRIILARIASKKERLTYGQKTTA